MSTHSFSNKKIIISTGEASGDLHAAYLIREINKIAPKYCFVGMGGNRLKAEGVDIRIDSSRKGVVGAIEALPFLGSFFLSLKKMGRLLKEEKPDLLLLLDSQGFNLPLAKEARKLGIKTVYYICPQEWLWGTPKGVSAVAKGIDHLFCIFRKEFDAYARAGGNVYYKGHPLLDIVKPRLTREEAYKVFDLVPNLPVVSLFAGNRKHEIKNVLPIQLRAARIMQNKIPGLQIIVPLFNLLFKEEIEKQIKELGLKAKTIIGYNYEALSISALALSSPGTVTLEAAILGAPVIATYKLSALSYFIGKHILKIKLPYFTMPNLLANKKVIPEFIQDEAKPENIAQEGLRLLQDPNTRDLFFEEYKKTKESLGLPDALPYLARTFVEIVEK